jgi:hypothetical protein
MLNCRKTVEKLLPNIIWTLRTETTRRLRQGAETAAPQVARDARAEADALDEKANAIGRTIEREFLQAFAETSDLDQTIELTVAPMFLKRPAAQTTPTPDVDILSAETIDQDATVIAIAHAAAERYKLKLFQLNVRLANVIGHPLDAESNPLVPLTACRLFWRATVSYCDSPRVRRCLNDTLRTRIVPLLGEVYEALDKSLDDDHVPHAFDSLGS